jgi:hypothetical protein
MTYLNIKTSEGVETIDSLDRKDFNTTKDFNLELRRLKNEYKLCNGFYSGIYSSQRCARAWRD